MADDFNELKSRLSTCQICTERFAATETQHVPRPVVWFAGSARILVAGQAPGLKVHEDGRPFWDRSGDRLREWMGLDKDTFYDQSRIAIVPMAFCFPGYDAQGSDLPPPPICARTWRAPIVDALSEVRLTLVIGAYAQKWHLDTKTGVTATVAAWRDHVPSVFPLPHPSWRNTAWLKKHPWFEVELLPVLRGAVAEALS